MIILLTNDDGIRSPGIKALEDALSPENDIWVVAPDGERSGASHAITLKGAVRIRELSPRHFSCDGTPADCVLYSFLGALPVRPDVVLSGINLGHNLGTDIIYSGTAGAAREAALAQVPGIAVSIEDTSGDRKLSAAAEFVKRNLKTFLGLWTPEHFVNINFPEHVDGTQKAVITHPARRLYQDKITRFKAPNNDFYFFLDGTPPANKAEADSDWTALSRGYISISPVYLHPVRHAEDEAYKKAVFA